MTLAKAEENLGIKNPLPERWRWIRLGEVCEFAYGSSLPEVGRNKGTIPVYGSNGIVGYHNEPITQGSTLIIGRKGSIGEVNYSSGPCWPIDTTYYVDGSKTPCDLRWLFFLLKFIKLDALNKASGVPGLNRNDAYDQLIPLLSTLAEQERIARVLDEQMAIVEKARAAAEARLEAAKALPSAYLREVFESPEARRWRREPLGGHVTKVGSGLTPLGGQSTYQKSGTPLIRSQNVHMNHFVLEGLAYISREIDEEMAGSRVYPGDVLLNITGASIGRVCIVPSELCPANVNQHVSIIRCKDSLNPDFLSFYLSTPEFQQFIMNTQAGATRQALTKTIIEQFEIPVPSLEEQSRLVATLRNEIGAAGKVMQVLQEELGTINALPAALLRRAFTGGL